MSLAEVLSHVGMKLVKVLSHVGMKLVDALLDVLSQIDLDEQ